MAQRKFVLDEKELPTHWYNIQADLPKPLPPPLHPGTGQPIGPADLAPKLTLKRLSVPEKRRTVEIIKGQDDADSGRLLALRLREEKLI